MSDITAAIQSIVSDISVDDKGVVSITRHGLCQLLGIRSDNLIFERMAKKLAERLTQIGFQISSVSYGEAIPDTAVALVIEYYAFDAQKTSPMAQSLYRAFATIGIRKFFQQAKGYEPKPVDKLTSMRQAYESMGKLIALYEYTENKPGLENLVNHGVEMGSKTLPGTVTLDDVLNHTGLEFSSSEKSAIGMYASTSYRSLTGNKPKMKKVRRVDKSGKRQTYSVAEYPIDFIPVIQNAIELGFSS